MPVPSQFVANHPLDVNLLLAIAAANLADGINDYN
jgi:hypothetical protein